MLSFAIGCSQLVEVEMPADQLITSSIYADDVTAIAALRGLYASTMSSTRAISNAGVSLMCGLSAGELKTVRPNADYDPFMENEVLPESYVISTLTWAPAYKTIYQANDLIEKSQQSHSLKPGTVRQITGEALLVRSLNFFYLTNLFGAVPLTLTTDYRTNTALQRSNTQDIYDQIERDLLVAADLLPAEYPSPDRMRANRWAAKSLLARLYLYQGKWQEAIGQASAVIEDGGYKLELTGRTFLSESKETILQFGAVGQYNLSTGAGQTFIPGFDVVPNYQVSSRLLSAYQSTDKRLQDWFLTLSLNGQNYSIPFKYKLNTSSGSRPEANIVFRLAELYLIRAEAYIQQSQIAEAVHDLNQLRGRADISLLDASGLTTEQLLEAVSLERQRELCIEWGHRWFDLKRMGLLDAQMNNIAPETWKPEKALYPIPSAERLSNPFLTQNPGYDD